MSDRNRLYCLALGGWLLAGLPFLCLTEAASQEQPDNSPAAHESADQQQGATAPKQEVPKEVVRPPEPIDASNADLDGGEDAAGDTQAENDHRQADLEAQQDMAYWAYLMVIVSGISVAIAGTAVYLVYLTLREAKNTTDAARESVKATADTAKRQLRAYLSAVPSGINQLIASDEGMGHVTIRNVGQLPARNVDVYVFMKTADERTVDFPVPAGDENIKRVIPPGTEMTQGSQHRIRVEELHKVHEYIYVWGIVYYADDDGYRHFTRFCHRYNRASRNRSLNLAVNPKKTRSIYDADKARYHTEGNDAD